MAGGLALLLSKGSPKGESDDDEEKDGAEGAADDDKEGGLEDELLGDAFDALKSGDRAGFISAMKNLKA